MSVLRQLAWRISAVIRRFPRRTAYLLALAMAVLPVAAASAATPMSAADFNLDAFKGKVVYLDFWASWCGPCKLSFPYMASLEQSYAGKDLVVVTVNLDHSRKKADAFLRDVGIQIPVIYDEKGKLATKFHVEQMPTSILFDRTGKLRYVHKGFFQDKEDDYSDHVYQLINENQK